MDLPFDAIRAPSGTTTITTTTTTTTTTRKKKKGGGYVLFPITHVKLWNLYKVVQGDFWTAEDVIHAPAADKRQPNAAATRFLASVAAAVRGAALPESLSLAHRNSEAACFLGFQAMQENIHLEALTHLASNDADNPCALSRSCWPAPPIPNAPPCTFLLRALKVAATYAAASAVLCHVIAEVQQDTVLDELASRIERDYDRSSKFALAMCVAFGGVIEDSREVVLEIGRDVVESVVNECNRALPNYEVDIRDYFVLDLQNELVSYQPPSERSDSADGGFAADHEF